METRVDEIAERIYRLSTFLPQVGPSGLTFNQFLLNAEEPLLFHCGQRAWLNDQAPRPPRALADGEVLELGGRRVRRLDTPHVPHCWDAGLLYEEATATLFTSDLFTHVGDPPALSQGDIVGPAMAAEQQFGFTAVTPMTGATIRRLAALQPRTLAVMHGSSFAGAAPAALGSLAEFYDDLLRKGMTPSSV